MLRDTRTCLICNTEWYIETWDENGGCADCGCTQYIVTRAMTELSENIGRTNGSS